MSQHDGAALDQYAKVPIRVETDRVIRCVPIDCGAGGFRLEEHLIDPPFAETFPDTEDEPFPRHGKWDVSEWGVFIAAVDDSIVGGCVVAVRTPQVRMLEGRTDLAVLWDLRVNPTQKGTGIGTELFQTAKRFARERGCTMLKIETQNVNVPACHFYRKQGCHLGGINVHAYSDYPDEVQLLWYLAL